MKTLLITTLMLFMASCSSTQFDKQRALNEQATENLLQEDQMIGSSLPNWIYSEGLNGNRMYAVGSAEVEATYSENYVTNMAIHNAKMRVVENMPTDYKKIVQRAVSDTVENNFNQVELSTGEVQGITGIKTNRRFMTCRKMIRYTEFGRKVNRVCYVQAFVPLKELNDAFVRTVKNKYGDQKADQFKVILEQQLKSSIKTKENQNAQSNSRRNRPNSAPDSPRRQQTDSEEVELRKKVKGIAQTKPFRNI